jgi:hypothetical protein
VCIGCALGKSGKVSFLRKSRSKGILDIINSKVSGPMLVALV